MATILDEIVAHTRTVVAAQKQQERLSDLEDRPLFGEARRPFAEALRLDRLAVIAEAKKASPSAGVIREPFDVAAIARSYDEHGAAAMSVLTEPDYFKGALENLELARPHFSGPLLRKDFLVDPYQVIQARAYGADAILLIATVLERGQLDELVQAAGELGLGVLVELYEERELDRVDLDQVSVIGVNNRNLHTFAVDRGHAPAVLGRLPDSIVRVAESGLRTREDLAFVRSRGIDAVLIGETFMRADDPGAALSELTADLP